MKKATTTKPKLILDTTQRRVYDFMKANKGITTLQANQELGETRLSARIFELKHKGVIIEDEWIRVRNRYKEDRRVKRYYIVGSAR